jgi:DNA-binding XRE family transcriptional regulator
VVGSYITPVAQSYLSTLGLVNSKYNQDYCKAFGAHLRQLREQKGIGMRQFALIADMEYSQLSKIERGVTNPTISTAFAIAEALGVPHNALFNFDFPSIQEI